MSVPFSRRDWLTISTAGCLSGWLAPLATEAARNPQRKRSCILLWMNGGPSTIDLWDLKPGHKNGGPFKEIATATPGVKISEHLPRMGKWSPSFAILRSMNSKEGDHGRASHLVRTGYSPQAAIRFPQLGALVARELTDGTTDLPPFVTIGSSATTLGSGGGFLGPKYNPLVLAGIPGTPTADALKVPNLRGEPGTDWLGRQKLLTRLDERFVRSRQSEAVASVRAARAGATRLMQPRVAQTFDLAQEKQNVRDGYGRNLFGQGCLLARRLVERGVAFVEVGLDGWDTHANNFARVKDLAGTVDTAWSALMADLKERGLLSSTLVVWVGEFGRTPKINASKGRDHWPNAFSAVLSGGGIKGGAVHGQTSKDGTTVEKDSIKVPDFLATVCKALGIDPTKQNLSNVNRPIRIVDKTAQPVKEVLA